MTAITGVRAVPCPTCKAPAGGRCINVKPGYGGYAKNVHKTRTDAWHGQPRTRVGPHRHTPLAGTLCMRSWDPADCDGFGYPQQHRCTQNRWVPHVCFCQSCAWDEADR